MKIKTTSPRKLFILKFTKVLRFFDPENFWLAAQLICQKENRRASIHHQSLRTLARTVARLSGLKNKNGGLSFGGKILLRVLWYFEVTKKPKNVSVNRQMAVWKGKEHNPLRKDNSWPSERTLLELYTGRQNRDSECKISRLKAKKRFEKKISSSFALNRQSTKETKC